MKLQPKQNQRFVFDDLVLDPVEALLTRQGQMIPLTPKEFELLCVLVSHAGHLIDKETLIKQVWPDTFVSDASLLRNISVLRKHLGFETIRTVPKRGYVFAVPVKALEKESNDSGAALMQVEQPIDLQCDDAGDNQAVDLQRSYPYVESIPPAQTAATAQRSSDWTPNHRRSALVLAIAALFTVVGLNVAHLRSMHVATQNVKASTRAIPHDVARAARLFVLNEGARSVSVFNTLSGSMESTISVESDPHGAAVLPDGSEIYISLNGTNRVVALNSRTDQIVASLSVGNSPVGVTANPRPPFVYVANNYSNSVSVIDSRMNAVVKELAVGAVPTEIAVSADGTRAIVTNQSSGTVTMIDAVNNTVLANIAVGSTPVGAAFTPDSKAAWVSLAGQAEIAVVDISSEKVVRRIHVGPGPVRVAITHDGKFALVPSFFSDTLTIINTASFRPVREITVGLNPVGVAFGPAGTLGYVANYGSGTVSIVDLRSWKLTRTVNVGAKPSEIAVLPCYSVPCS